MFLRHRQHLLNGPPERHQHVLAEEAGPQRDRARHAMKWAFRVERLVGHRARQTIEEPHLERETGMPAHIGS